MKLINSAALIIVFLSCEKKGENFQKKLDVNSVENSQIEIIDECSLILNFLSFYEENYDKIYEKSIIDYTSNYKIDFINLNNFMLSCKFDHYFSENYISSFRKKINIISEKLINNPQNDGIVEGLESDLFLFTQEIEEFLEQIKKNQISCKRINDNKYQIHFDNGNTLNFIIVDSKIENIYP